MTKEYDFTKERRIPSHIQSIKLSPSYAKLLSTKLKQTETTQKSMLQQLDEAVKSMEKGNEELRRSSMKILRSAGMQSPLAERLGLSSNVLRSDQDKEWLAKVEESKRQMAEATRLAQQQQPPVGFQYTNPTNQGILGGKSVQEMVDEHTAIENDQKQKQTDKRLSIEQRDYSLEKSSFAMKKLLQAKQSGKRISDSDLLGFDASKSKTRFENQSIRDHHMTLLGGMDANPFEFVKESVVNQIKKWNSQIDKEIAASKEITNQKQLAVTNVKQKRTGLSGKLLDSFDGLSNSLFGNSQTEHGQFTRQVYSQMARSFAPRAYSRATQAYDLLNMLHPPGNGGIPTSGGGGRFGGIPPIGKGGIPGGAGGMGRGAVSIAEGGASRAGMALMSNPATIAVGVTLVAAATAAAVAMKTFSKASETAAKEIERLQEVAPNLRAAMAMADVNLRVERFHQAQQDGPGLPGLRGPSKSLDVLLGERATMNNQWKIAGERVTTEISRIFLQTMNPISQKITQIVDILSKFAVQAIRFGESLSIGVSEWIKANVDQWVPKWLKDVFLGIDIFIKANSKAEATNDALSDLNAIFFGVPGAGENIAFPNNPAFNFPKGFKPNKKGLGDAKGGMVGGGFM